jgi:hypothetical protein
MSVGPPGANGTTMRSGLSGKPAAVALQAKTDVRTSAAALEMRERVFISICFYY